MKRYFVWTLAVTNSLLAIIRLVAVMMGLVPKAEYGMEVIVFLLTTFILSIAGALIIVWTGGNRVGWLLLLLGFVLVDPFRLYVELNYTAVESDLSFGMYVALWTQGWFFFLILYGIFLIILHFPDGRPPTPRWNWVNVISLLTLGQHILAQAVQPRYGDESYLRVENPIALLPVSAYETISGLVFGLGLVFLGVTSVSSIFVRYRRADSVVRTQIKWVLFAGVISFAAIGYRLATYNPESNDWTDYLLSISLVLLVLSITISILRYRLYDIDFIIRRTLQYSLLTGILTLVFLGGVIVLQGVFQGVSGRGDSPLITVISTLLIAALFNPVRVRTQNWIDRRFYRSKYDAERAMTEFAEMARDEVDIDMLTTKLIQVVVNTMQPKDVWLSLKTPQEDK